MNDLGSQPAQAGMMMLGVVPGEEALTETPGVLDATKTDLETPAGT